MNVSVGPVQQWPSPGAEVAVRGLCAGVQVAGPRTRLVAELPPAEAAALQAICAARGWSRIGAVRRAVWLLGREAIAGDE